MMPHAGQHVFTTYSCFQCYTNDEIPLFIALYTVLYINRLLLTITCKFSVAMASSMDVEHPP